MNDVVTLRKEDFQLLMGRVTTLQTTVDRMASIIGSYDPDIHKTLLTTEEAASMMGFRSYAAFRQQRLRHPGAFPDPVQVGGVQRYRVSDIETWVRNLAPVSAT